MDTARSNEEPARWPLGGGEMAQRVRDHEWSATPLGPSAGWPQSLHTTVQTLLAHPLPTIVLWGPQLIQLYNDAYRDLMGEKHPAGLGQPTRACWPEVWHINAPIYERVWRGESVSLEDALFPITRSGQLEDAWFSLTYSPVRDEVGQVGGVLLTIIKTTRRRHVEAALRESQARQAFLLRLSDALRSLQDAQAIEREATQLLGEQLGANRVFYAEVRGDDWLVTKGYEQGVAPLSEGPHPARAYGPWIMDTYRAAQRLVFHDSGTDPRFSPPQRQAHAAAQILAAIGVPLVKQGVLVAILAVHSAALRHWSDAEVALVEETAERTWAAVEQARMQAALRESEERYRALFESMDEAYAVVEVLKDSQGAWADFRFLEVNPAFMQHTSMPYPVGKTATQLLGTPNPYWAQVYGQVLDTGVPVRVEQVEPMVGRTFDLNIFALERSQNRVAVLFTNITQRKAAEAALRESEVRARKLVEGLAQATWETNAAGEVATDSPSWRHYTGQSHEQWLGYGWLDAIHPDDRGHAQHQWREAVAARRAVNAEFRLRHAASGGYRWTNVRAVPLLADDGVIEKWVGMNIDIHDRKQAEEALRRSEQQLALAFETLPMGIGIIDAVGSLIRLNDGMRRFLPTRVIPSRDPERMGRWRGWDTAGLQVEPKDFPGARALRGETVSPGIQMLYLDDEGRQTWTEVRSAPLRDGDGEITGALVVVIDVDRLKRSEAAARQSEERLLLAVNVGELATWDWDLATGQVVWSPAHFRMLGYVPGEVEPSYQAWLDRVHPQDRASAEAALQHAREQHLPYMHEFRVVHADGAVRWLSAQGCYYYDEADTAVRMIGVVRDVSEQRHARESLEQQVAERTAELQRTAARERAILASAASAIVATDLAGRITSFNPAAEAMFGRAATDALGTPVLDLYDPEDLHSHLADFPPEVVQVLRLDDAARIQGSPGGERSEWIYVRADGTRFPGLLSVSVLRDAQGAPLGLLGVVTDLTERKALEETLRQRTHQAEGANRSKSAFLANMSHEIRTPMNAILGLAHLLRREELAPRQDQRVSRIEDAARHLLSIINDILDLSRIDAGKLQLEERDFELPALLEQVRSIMGEGAMAKGVRVEVDAGDVPSRLRGDETRVRQALLNYAGNAVKFTGAGSITLRARLEQQREAKLLVRFEVEDTGIGIQPQQVARLFKAFEQADASTTREHGGTGLGLAITRRLAELMGGHAGASPRPGGGSVFWFTAWLEQGAEAPAQEALHARADAALRQRHAGARVLVVEDHPVNREVALALLRAVALEVDFAENGAIAVEKAVHGHYGLVLMDMQMPVMDGLQATRALRAVPELHALPILAMTANAFGEDRAACLAAGMNDFVSKPVEPQTLYATILKWLDRAPPVSLLANAALPGAAPDTGTV